MDVTKSGYASSGVDGLMRISCRDNSGGEGIDGGGNKLRNLCADSDDDDVG